MADFEQVLSRAIMGLPNNTSEFRRALYDRARTSLVNQLKNMTPPLQQTEIARQRLALEHAIRKVESQLAMGDILRREKPAAAETPAPTPKPIEPPAPKKAAPTLVEIEAPAAPLVDATVEAARVEDTPQSKIVDETGQEEAQLSAVDVPEPRIELEKPSQIGGQLKRGNASVSPSISQQPIRIHAPIDEMEADTIPQEYSAVPQQPSLLARTTARLNAKFGRINALLTRPKLAKIEPYSPLELDPTLKPPRFGRGHLNLSQRRVAMVSILLLLGVLGAGGMVVSADMVGRIFSSVPRMVIGAGDKSAMPTTKHTQRLSPETEADIAAQKAPIDSDVSVNVAQAAILYEENPNVPQKGEAFKGQILWSVETENGTDGKPEKFLKGIVDIPARKMKMTMALKRNFDLSIPASHTIELAFELAPDFVQKGISSIPGVLMKPAEQARGVPLMGASARITSSYFLIALSNVAADRDRNILTMKERSWLEVPLLYESRLRAVLVFDKGTTGERMFKQVFSAWKQ